jgi:diguanylate cyclase (GGDEF)-like protein/PAS domain S-box-containing protein
MGSQVTPLSLRRLTAGYLAGLLLIAGISAAFRLTFIAHYQHDNRLAYLINISGRQRMLSQRIASLVTAYKDNDLTARAPLLTSAAELLDNQQLLEIHNLKSPEPDAGGQRIRQIYFGPPAPLSASLRRFVAEARQVALLPPDAPQAAAARADILAQARVPLLQVLNEVVTIHQRQADAAMDRLNRIEQIAFSAILATLLAEGLFIFRPMIRLVGRRAKEAKILNDALAERHELLRVTLRAIGDGVITTDTHGRITWMNPVAENLTGWCVDQAAGRPIEEVFAVFHEETGATVPNPITICLAENRIAVLAAQTMLRSRHGDERGIQDSAAPIVDGEGRIIGAVLVFSDVTQQHKLAGEMTYRATHDALTGLLNRAEFEHRMAYQLHKAHADQTENAILYIDLDQFKLINESCGHTAGDQMLLEIAKLLSGLVRASDTAARLGGDEFAILLDRCPMEHAQVLAQNICERLDDYRFAFRDQRIRVGASIGLVPMDSRWSDSVALLHAAEACCYAAKEAGRNRVYNWSDSEQRISDRHGQARWATRLEQALDEDRFVLFAQRIRSVGHGAAGARPTGVHAEILVRMVDVDGTLLQPGAFLPAAERFHLASRIDRWVLSHVLSWMNAQPSIAFIDMLAVNMSGQSVADASFQAWALAELAAADPRIAQRICLEITETAAVTNLADAAQFIDRLKTIGVRVALDDFGAGASSFGYLKSMAADFLKIDGRFVRDLLIDKLDASTVRCFIEIAKLVGMQTIAEFTESADIMNELQAMGVDFAQGYHVHHPSPIDELIIPATKQFALA